MKARDSLLVVGLLVAAACGGNPPEVATPTPPAPSEMPAPPPPAASAAPEDAAAPAASVIPAATTTPPPAVPPKSWGDMTHEERLSVMKLKVLPTMKEEFQKVDPKDFADFTCVTCHGQSIKQGKFDMPNPALPKLNPKNGFKDEKAKHPAVLKFMIETVVPKMSEMLNVPKYDPATHAGFGCGNCHTMVK